MTTLTIHRCQQVINEICGLNWSALTRAELMAVSWAYYYFSVQFCDTLRAGSACLNTFLRMISGASAGFRLPRSATAG
jgi:hypothetical protein